MQEEVQGIKLTPIKDNYCNNDMCPKHYSQAYPSLHGF